MSTLRVNNLTDAGGTGPTYAPGHIIQTLQSDWSANFSTTGTSFVNSNLSVTITPKSVNSKILIFVTTSVYSDTDNCAIVGTIFRNGVTGINLGNGANGMAAYQSTGNYKQSSMGLNAYDFPNTTSSVTYNFAIATTIAGNAVYAPISGRKQTMVVMEVAA